VVEVARQAAAVAVVQVPAVEVIRLAVVEAAEVVAVRVEEAQVAVVQEEAVQEEAVPAAVVQEEVAAVALNSNPRREARAAVTLLELLLALSLSIVVLTAVSMAINLYFKMLDVRRTSLEEMQVVRVVTQRMTNDIRMLVQPNAPDLSGLETAMNNAMQAAAKQAAAATGVNAISIGGSAGTGGTAGSGGQAAGGSGSQAGSGQGNQTGGGQGQGTGGGTQSGQSGTGGGQSGASGGQASKSGSSGSQTSSSSTGSSTAASGSTGGTSTETTEEKAATVVQLVGSATELRFDISRLPRVDQYKGIMTQGGELSAVDLPSDVKTIAYFIRSTQSAQSYADDPRAIGGEASTDGYGRGLMRAEMDRAVTLYADAGTGESVYSYAQLLANEVVGLGFEYFDGTEWLTDWDSATSSGLPRAIRVWLSIQPTYGMSEQELAEANAGKEVPPTDFYIVISLPTAPLVAPTTTETETTDSSTSTTPSGTSSTTGTTP
jgi:hypothetical protein